MTALSGISELLYFVGKPSVITEKVNVAAHPHVFDADQFCHVIVMVV
jgi:hypothetical protein